MAQETSNSNIAELLAEARSQLRASRFDISTREATLLLAHLLDWSEAQVRSRGEQQVDDELAERYRRWIERRLEGEPVAYLVGDREFYGRVFAVDDRVLIPRPETEHIVEIALELELPDDPWILDLGTGSGCLAVTLAAEIAGAKVVAVDLSPAALAVFDANRRRHGVADWTHGVAGDLSSALRLERFDLVVSNPPYVDHRELATLSTEVTGYEPHLALFAPGPGSSLIERLLDDARQLRPGVHLLIEMGYDQGAWLRDAAGQRDFLELLEIRQDLSGIPRIAVLRRRGGF